MPLKSWVLFASKQIVFRHCRYILLCHFLFENKLKSAPVGLIILDYGGDYICHFARTNMRQYGRIMSSWVLKSYGKLTNS